MHFNPTFNLLVIFRVLNLFVIVITVLHGQQSFLSVHRVFLLSWILILRISCIICLLVILILTLVLLSWLVLNFTVQWRVMSCWILGSLDTLFCDIPILMNVWMRGNSFGHRLRNLLSCISDLVWLGVLLGLGVSSLGSSLLSWGSRLLLWGLRNGSFLRFFRGLRLSWSLFGFFNFLSFFSFQGWLCFFFLRSWSLFACELSLTVLLLALGNLFVGFFGYLGGSCILGCLFGFVDLHFLFVAFLLDLSLFQVRSFSGGI